MTWISILAGFSLSWLELEGLRRTVNRILAVGNPRGVGWALAFGARWMMLAVLFWILLHIFKANFLCFVVSFLVSNFALRHWSVYAKSS